MRTITLKIDRTDLKENEGVALRVYEASSMGDMALQHSLEIMDEEERKLVINDRQAIELRSLQRYDG